MSGLHYWLQWFPWWRWQQGCTWTFLHVVQVLQRLKGLELRPHNGSTSIRSLSPSLTTTTSAVHSSRKRDIHVEYSLENENSFQEGSFLYVYTHTVYIMCVCVCIYIYVYILNIAIFVDKQTRQQSRRWTWTRKKLCIDNITQLKQDTFWCYLFISCYN